MLRSPSTAGLVALALLRAQPATAFDEAPWFFEADAEQRAWLEAEEPPSEHERSETRRRFDDDPWHAEAIVGFGTLVGFSGVLLGYNVHDRLELGGGVGANLFGAVGGGYIRLRPLVHMAAVPRRLHAMSFDVGLGVGRYRDVFAGLFAAASHDDADGRTDSVELARWLQLETSWETWSQDGFTLRLGGGMALRLADGPGTTVVTVFTLALGHAF